ncbi:MAG TPA: hypothetical protein VGJ83_04795 [Gemmatimonadales bacterium]
MAPSAVRIVGLSMLLGAFAGPTSAQTISIKTVPIAQGDQFQIFPSNNFGMGGVSIALADALLDPWVNPAKAARLGPSRFYSAPTVYTLSRQAGGGRTLPVAAIAGAGSWYGGVALALQEVDASRNPVFQDPGGFVVQDLAADDVAIDLNRPPEQTHGNTYVQALVGKALPAAGVSLGASVQWGELRAIDGVDLLYAGSQRVDQFGHELDLRLGLLKEWNGGRSLEALMLHNRFGMKHDVIFVDQFWNPALQQFDSRPRLEHNLDRTNTWGLHLVYQRPLSASGWRIGWVATANRMSHPKLPEYELANVPLIPRDPGRSTAFNFGVGLSKTRGPGTFAIEALLEPIWSHTWADAAVPVVTALGDTIPPGGPTLENHFRFSNWLMRMGLSREVGLRGLGKAAELQLGLVLRTIHYHLDQYDNVQLAGRDLEQRWLEWTPTWGLSLRFPELEIRYRGRVTHGTGRPGVQSFGGWGVRDVAAAGGSILVAPSGPLSLTDVNMATHQISISLPLR